MRTSILLSVALALASATVSSAQQTAVLEIPELGLAMNHPADWQVTTVGKSKDIKVLIPIEGSSQKAMLELYSVPFSSEREVWQLGQKAINERMKREVMRQWEEELLGAPLLLTKVNYVEKSGAQLLMIGMVYSRTPKKLMFRLSAAPDDFDKAEFIWRETMNSFRTGQPWSPEDPTQKPDPKAPPRTQLPKPVVIKANSLDGEAKLVKPPVAIEVAAAGRKLELRIPGEWAGKVQEDGSVLLTNPEVGGPVRILVASVLDSDPPQKALLTASSKTLGEYQKVTKRDEILPTKNKAGAMLASVWRSGLAAQGDLFSCDAAGSSGDFYFLAAFKSANATKIGAERKLIESLLQNMTIQVVP
jgi:hypothetical protein